MKQAIEKLKMLSENDIDEKLTIEEQKKMLLFEQNRLVKGLSMVQKKIKQLEKKRVTHNFASS